jgi:integrase
MGRLPQHVKRVETPAGQPRYEARVNATNRDGTRLQLRKRFKSPAAADDWHRQITNALADGGYALRKGLTVRQACEEWLAAKQLRIKPTTAAAYTAALAPVIQRYGKVPVHQITRGDVETLIAELIAGTPGRIPWQRTSINPMLARWRAVFTGLHADGTLPRNVVALVEPLRKPSGQAAMKIDDSLTAEESEQLLAAHVGHHREAFVQLALLGLRRGELGGLRWSAVDLKAAEPTLTIRATRVATPDGTVEQDDAKTASSIRVLPIPPHLVPILRRTKSAQHQMRFAAGNLWEGERDLHVVTHELGRPPAPRTLDSWWHASLKLAELTPRRLHASRHTAASLLNARGASVTTIAAWLGHSDGGALAMSVYVKTRSEALSDASRLFG